MNLMWVSLDALGRLAGSKRVGKDALMGANALQSSRKCRKSSTGVCYKAGGYDRPVEPRAILAVLPDESRSSPTKSAVLCMMTDFDSTCGSEDGAMVDS
jgi:hypothetical protein